MQNNSATTEAFPSVCGVDFLDPRERLFGEPPFLGEHFFGVLLGESPCPLQSEDSKPSRSEAVVVWFSVSDGSSEPRPSLSLVYHVLVDFRDLRRGGLRPAKFTEPF